MPFAAEILTREIRPTPLSASHRSPFLSISMFRTVPPPPGIGQVWNFFVSGLNRIEGFTCRMPRGAFYAFPNIRRTGWKSKELADALLVQAGVACLSGPSFGEFGEGYLRFSVANSMENLNRALERISSWAEKNIQH